MENGGPNHMPMITLSEAIEMEKLFVEEGTIVHFHEGREFAEPVFSGSR